MWDAAKKLAKDKAFSRIDFYQPGDKVLFGEITTFYPTSGMGGFRPLQYDNIVEDFIILPQNNSKQ